jgi:disulfide bond formation protein DsbB
MEKQNTGSIYIFLAFLVASIATLGSLFFSEIMEFIPCTMCWYQRIFMYPLVLIFLVNLLYPDEKVFKYSISLVLVGLFFSIYHNLLMWGIIPETIVPFLSLVSYSSILVLLILWQNKKSK